MSFPNSNPATASSSGNQPPGGRLAGAAGQPVKPQPAAPLTDEQLRLECAKLVVAAKVGTKYITASAERIYQYIKTGQPSVGPFGRDEGA